MRDRVVGYGRLLYVSTAALSLSACARMHLSDPTLFAVEPQFGEAPEAGAMAHGTQPKETEAERMAKLEAQIAALSADVAHLRRALEILDRQPQEPKPRPASLPASFPEAGKLAAMSHLYAQAPPAPKTSRSLFYEADLGSFPSRQTAEDCWRRLSGEAAMADLNPRFTVTGAETRLTVGPLLSEAAVDALSIDVSAISGPCRGFAPMRAY